MIIFFLRQAKARCKRKCRNWQTSKTKDLVAIAVVWVQVPSPAPRQVVEIRLVFLLLIHFKTAVAELHQIFDLVEAELVPQHEIFDFVEAEMLGVSAA